jgi:hypothetical protein
MSIEASYTEDLEIDLERSQMLAADLLARLDAVKAERDRLREAAQAVKSAACSNCLGGWVEAMALLSAALATPAVAGEGDGRDGSR